MDEEKNTEVTEAHDVSSADGANSLHRETVTRSSNVSSRVVAKRVIWYVAGVIIILLALRVILLLLAANQGNAFVDFIYAVGGVFAAPFYGIFNYTPHYGHFYFEISSVVAAVIYALVAWGLTELLDIGRRSDSV